jgi:ABC-type sugar transport system substrate-binding protein
MIQRIRILTLALATLGLSACGGSADGPQGASNLPTLADPFTQSVQAVVAAANDVVPASTLEGVVVVDSETAAPVGVD